MPNPYEHDNGCPICRKPDDKCECDDVGKTARKILERYREVWEKLADS